jgi:hypothetical protein
MKSRTDFIAGTFFGLSWATITLLVLPRWLALSLIGLFLAKCVVMFFLVRREEAEP